MSSLNESDTDVIDTQYSSSKIKKYQEKDGNNNNNNNNLKSLVKLKDIKSVKKVSNKSKQKQKSNTKKVLFNKKITIIDVESWKKYNAELTDEEELKDLNEDDNQKKNKEGKKGKNKAKKKEHISCVCLII